MLKGAFRRYSKRVKDLTDKTVIRWASKSPRRASFYYFFFSHKFDREHHAVIYGKHLHITKDKKSMSDEATLRRSVHMIEKGLITVPRKLVFAEGYILNTVAVLERFLLSTEDFSTQKWAYDVLKNYFDIVQKTTIIEEAEQKYRKIVIDFPLHENGQEIFAPYSRSQSKFSPISFENYYNLCQQRRSVRWYKDKPVPLELVTKAIKAALTAPSACNRQPFRFILVEDKDLLQKVATFPMGCDTFGHNIKLMAILIGDQSNYFDERDRHLIYIDGGLAVMNFILALETLGLSSCTVNWPDISGRERMLAKQFGLSPNERCIIFISIGYALNEGGIAYSSKKQPARVITKY